MKKTAILTSVGVLTMLAVSACGANTSNSNPQPATSANPAPTANATQGGAASNSSANNTAASNAQGQSATTAKPVNLTVQIVTGKMDGKPGWPKFEPADTTLPANTVVNVTVKDYDDGPATVPAGYNAVKGTQNGTITVDGKTVSSIPAKDVAHTITIPSMNLNVPIPPKTSAEKYATVQFSFKTPATPQKLDWQCMAACGSGSSGWQGAMATDGWMKGVYTVQ
ncbi:hypothetical protein LLE49_12480 [Alicyclobacillus tolerans]|uniref:hypothetical protein n=1 Tax=Alicyclobacillus tolerans TaxID=90970 RepID=UPI001F23AACA|nr:hypothetical protein [Alicyclobacillus tolerans]MCF8565533.1 hypothetical protein [Alicyclobacillus tolerans]